jgi:hypothetical protein
MPEEDLRKCKRCERELPLHSFYKRKGGGFLSPCKFCKIEISKERLERSKENPELREKLKNYGKKSFQKNKEKRLEKTKSYYKANKIHYQNYQKTYGKNNPRKKRKRFTTVEGKLRASVSRAISKNIRKMGGEKLESSMPHLDFTYEELKIHLESLFDLWMNWSNYGIYDPKTWDDNNPSTWKWQIDHVTPHSELLYSSYQHKNFHKCWSLNNLRPYSAKQNILDGSNRTRHKKENK